MVLLPHDLPIPLHTSQAENSYQTVPMHTQRMSDKSGISKANRLSKSGIAKRRLAKMPLKDRNPALAQKIAQMRLTIAPIVHVETGKAAAEFPHTMLDLFLLTEDQLDALAHFYHQVTPTELTHQYPQTMDWELPFLDKDLSLPEKCRLSDLERLKVKMRMFARFIGMRGADTPTWEYERQVEILRNKIERSVQEGENSSRKFNWGPTTRP